MSIKHSFPKLNVDVLTGGTSINTDSILEKTAATGVTIDGVLLKDSNVLVDIILEKTAATGVTIDGVLLKDSVVTTDQIDEKTAAAGVTIDGLLIKDDLILSLATSTEVVTSNVVDLIIDDSGNIGIAASILAMKTNIESITNIDWLYNLDTKKYNFKKRKVIDNIKTIGYTSNDFSDTEFESTKEFGMIAEDLEKLYPDLCMYRNIIDHVEGCDKKNCDCPSHKELRGIKYTKFIPFLLKAIQSLKKEINELRILI